MKSKLLCIGVTKSAYEPQKIKAEARALGFSYTFAHWRELLFDLRGDALQIITARKKDVRSFDFIWMRSAKFGVPVVLTMEYMLSRPNCKVLNDGLVTMPFRNNKFFQYAYLKKHNFPIIPSAVKIMCEHAQHIDAYFSKPYILKGAHGSKGKRVYKIDSERDLQSLIGQFNSAEMIAQQYMPIKSDYRVLVLGGDVLGAIQRSSKGIEFRTNFSLGGSVKSVDLPDSVKEMVKNVALVFHADFCGVDLIEHKGNYYILELNFAPGFEGFEQATGINVPNACLKYLTEKKDAVVGVA